MSCEFALYWFYFTAIIDIVLHFQKEQKSTFFNAYNIIFWEKNYLKCVKIYRSLYICFSFELDFFFVCTRKSKKKHKFPIFHFVDHCDKLGEIFGRNISLFLACFVIRNIRFNVLTSYRICLRSARLIKFCECATKIELLEKISD